MILRRLTNAFRKQDWFTVTVEIMIVVLGVFIGLQVNNWNIQRMDKAQSSIILERLAQDFEQIIERSDRSLEDHKRNLAAVGRLIRGIRSGNLEDETLFKDMRYAAAFSAPPGTSATFTQLVASGRLELVRNQNLKGSMIEYDTFISFVSNQYQLFEGPTTQTRQTLIRASTLRTTGIPVTNYDELFQRDAVDRDMLLNNPEILNTLQIAYATQENIYVFLYTNRASVVSILEQIRAEQETGR